MTGDRFIYGYWSTTPIQYPDGDTTLGVWLLGFGCAEIFPESKGFMGQAFFCVRG